MKRHLFAFVAIAVTGTFLNGTGTSLHGEEASTPKQSLRETPIVKAVRKAKPSVVTLKVTRSSAYSTREVVGSGVVFDERGYVVTNRHVVSASSGIRALLADGTECAAHVLCEDARHDLAIVQLTISQKLPAITFAPAAPERLLEGETVIAIGHPYGYLNTVSTGIISALDREITMPTGEKLTGLIQVTAAINPGNSGGPLLNIYGDLIGINVAVRDGAQGISFALNADMVQGVLAKHLSAANISRVEHGLACHEAAITDTDEPRTQVVVDSGAQPSLKHGDVIRTVGQRVVTNRLDLERSLWGCKAGDIVAACVVRDGKETQVTLTLSDGHASATDTTPLQGAAATAQPVGQK